MKDETTSPRMSKNVQENYYNKKKSTNSANQMRLGRRKRRERETDDINPTKSLQNSAAKELQRSIKKLRQKQSPVFH